MKIKKTTLYKWMLAYDNIDQYITDVWFQWKHKELYGYYQWEAHKHNCDRWRNLLRSMPELAEWSIEDDHIEIRGVNKDGKYVTEQIPLKEFIDPNDKQPDLEMLWHRGYWDGPLSGVALYNGDVVYFDCKHDYAMGEDEDELPLWGLRTYSLYEITEEQKFDLTFNHILFREMVGLHCDHRPEFYDWFTRGGDFKFFYEDLKECRDKHKHLWDIDYKKGKELGVFAYHEFKNYMRPRTK